MTKAGGLLLAALALALSGTALGACVPPERGAPREAVVADRQALIAWKPVEGATAYRVRVLSRVPNGRIVVSHDTVVAATQFVSPQPLADDRAKVTARISAVCGAETSAETVFSFTIDATATCRLGELGAEVQGARAALKWTAVKGAASYEVRTFSLDGAFVSAQETRAAAAQVELQGPGAVVSVRPTCASGLGEAVYRVLAAEGAAD
jgi:hypothetical protein